MVPSMQAAVGGRMRFFISGGAPLPTYAALFMATAMNVPVLQVGLITVAMRLEAACNACSCVRHVPK